MAQVINTNMAGINASRNLAASNNMQSSAIQRLSSGLRVNVAKDDAAGLAISERMNSQIRGMNVASRNANDAISMVQTAESSLTKVTDNLQRMRELAVQAKNVTNSNSDKDDMDKEFGELAQEVQRVLGNTSFNGKKVLAGDAGTMTFQVGANTSVNDTINITTSNLTTDTTITTVAGTDQTGAGRAMIDNTATATAIGTVIDNLDAAITTVSSQRSTFGASQNRFEATIANLSVSVENQTNARSRIMDADYAAESANLSRAGVLQQAGTAMLAQANQLPQQVLSLLR